MEKRILDVACGGKMFYYDKDRDDMVFMDIRDTEIELCDGRIYKVHPDILGDFRSIPFPDESFYMVVFDPPHLFDIGVNSFIGQKYGCLNEASWAMDIRQGMEECFRVLKPNGTLIFKWSEEQIQLSELLQAIGYKPMFGNKNKGSKTRWLVFMK
jgi:ubiquinone/menaquinone biosynthesis C-methylase UbiE